MALGCGLMKARNHVKGQSPACNLDALLVIMCARFIKRGTDRASVIVAHVFSALATISAAVRPGEETFDG